MFMNIYFLYFALADRKHSQIWNVTIEFVKGSSMISSVFIVSLLSLIFFYFFPLPDFFIFLDRPIFVTLKTLQEKVKY